jgi:hypothetical protein
MIRLQWDSKELARKVCDFLTKKGVEVIIDDGGIHGDFLDWMAKSVAASDAVILVLTSKYEVSTNCRVEAQRAHELKKKIIPLVGEAGYSGGDACLSILVAGKIRYDVLAAFEENMNNIVERELGL